MSQTETKQLLSRRHRKKWQCQCQIEAAALFLFKKRGLDATRIEEITERADVAKGTFFNYYKSKHDVLATRCRRLARNFLDFARPDASGSPRQQLFVFFTAVEELFLEEGAMLLSLYGQVLARPDLRAVDADVEEKIIKYYRTVLEKGRADGVFRRDLDLGLATRMVLDLWSATLRLWVMETTSFGLAKELDRKLGMLIQGMTKP